MKKILVLFGLLFLINANAQTPLEPCAAHHVHAQKAEANNDYAKAVQKTFERAKEIAKKRKLNKDLTTNPILKIPVVVHVVYNTEDENLPDELIHSQIATLNEHFRHLNENAADLREVFEDVVDDPRIEFYLAEEDPDGNPTDGITRTSTDVEAFGPSIDTEALAAALEACGIEDINTATFDQILCLLGELGDDLDLTALADPNALNIVKAEATGGKDPWDTDKYLNLWVCNLGGTILGFAYPPTEAPNWPDGTIPDNVEEVDGVVIHYQVFGKDNPFADVYADIAGAGVTPVHEVGHYLGLRHIWGDPGIGEDGCTTDDGMEDTPEAASNSQPTDPNSIPSCEELFEKDSCPNDELPDMIENYMDYSVESCQNSFTIDQIGLMRSMLEIARSGLLSKIEVDFVASATEIYPGDSVDFSLTENVNTFELLWDFGDGTNSSEINPNHTYTTTGFYNVSLTGTNPTGESVELKNDYIQVLDVIGVEEIETNNWDVYPNPNNGLFSIQQINNCNECLITIFDAQGKEIKRVTSNETGQVRIDLTEEAKGIYFVSITDQGKTESKKILVK